MSPTLISLGVLLVTLPERARLLHWLTQPDVVVLLLGLGTLLIFTECNLPGAILPGAAGLLLLLSGAFALTLLPLHRPAILLLLASLAALALSAKLPAFGLPAPLGVFGVFEIVGILGTIGLVVSLLTLIVTPRTHPVVAVAVGTIVGISAALLGRVANQARRNKAVLNPHASHPPHADPVALERLDVTPAGFPSAASKNAPKGSSTALAE